MYLKKQNKIKKKTPQTYIEAGALKLCEPIAMWVVNLTIQLILVTDGNHPQNNRVKLRAGKSA